jgi:Protein of unknown function (DUF2817)
VALTIARDERECIIKTNERCGAEGFCGSGCQIALLHDDELQGRLDKAGMALLLIHAVNPYGFSHLRRVNEDNIDLNRNFLDFEQALLVNSGYAVVYPLVLPDAWPPGEANEKAISEAIEKGGRSFQNAVSTGQTTHPDGLFYAGRAPASARPVMARKYLVDAMMTTN